jgi:hypothetical protein
MNEIKRAMSVEEAAKAAGVGRTILFEEIRKGRIIAKKGSVVARSSRPMLSTLG